MAKFISGSTGNTLELVARIKANIEMVKQHDREEGNMFERMFLNACLYVAGGELAELVLDGPQPSLEELDKDIAEVLGFYR